jgi:predicted aspartyl protease
MPRNKIARRSLIGGVLGLALTGKSWAQAAQLSQKATVPQPAQAEDAPIELLDAWVDAYGRPTAKVQINGMGPFNFMVDTGSNTTVIAERIVERVGATPLGSVMVHGTTGSAEMPLVELKELSTGAASIESIRVAVLRNAQMPRDHGILGADVFVGRRLTFDILNRKVSVEPARTDWRTRSRSWTRTRTVSSDALLTDLRVRNGMLAEIDGYVGKIRAKMMLDTGAQTCLINPRLASRLLRSSPSLRRVNRVVVTGVTGHKLIGDYLELPEIRMGTINVRDAGAVIVDASVFKVWDMEEDSALIVGVDMLSRLSSFAIDYGAKVFEAVPMARINGDSGSLMS